MTKRWIYLLAFSWLLVPAIAEAHCPLCTIGAGAAALGASWLGVSDMAVGVFIGAFSIAIGIWLGKMIMPKYKHSLALISFGLTVFPLMAMFKVNSYWYLPIGDYGSVQVINHFLLGSVIGAVLMFWSPIISQKIGKRIPYQGIIVTFSMLTIASLIIELWL